MFRDGGGKTLDFFVVHENITAQEHCARVAACYPLDYAGFGRGNCTFDFRVREIGTAAAADLTVGNSAAGAAPRGPDRSN